MVWTAFLLHTVTGRIGPQVEIASLSWTVSLNNLESLSASLKKSSMPTNAKVWLSPWWGSILVCYGDVPIFAGPIISRPTEDFNNISVACAGIRALLVKRLITKEYPNDWSKIADEDIFIDGRSLGTIAKELVKRGINKTGGALPISFANADELLPNDEDHQRTYRGFNVSNISVDSLLNNLSGVSHGPDIMFRAKKVNDAQISWVLHTGTESNPRIAQKHDYVWDTTAVDSSVSNLSVVSTGAYMTNRVYSTGAGADKGTLITVSEDLSGIGQGFPLLETVISTSQSEQVSVVKAHGNGNLEANLDMLRELTLTVRADGVNPLGTYWPGDLVKIVTKGWLTLEDGVHNCRLLTMTGALNQDVRLSLQTE